MADNEKVQEAVLIQEVVPVMSAPAADISGQLARLKLMTDALDPIRAAFIKSTTAGDWAVFGDAVYLEATGAERLAPLLGLKMTNVRIVREVLDDGTISVTTTADFHSTTLGTTYTDISRTRRDNDKFLTQNGKKERADIEDVAAASYSGCLTKGVQRLAGLSGLTPEDLKTRFGFSGSAKAVEFRTGKAEAKQADRAATSEPVKEIHKLLYKLSMGNEQEAGDILERITENKAKGFPGKRSADKLTEAGIKWALPKLREMEVKFDKDLREQEGGGE